jgi:hypothetical protein
MPGRLTPLGWDEDTGLSNTSLFLIGLAIGVLVAILGGSIEYGLHLRRDKPAYARMPGCLLYTIGGLILAGIAAIITSLVLTGGVWPALIMGAGVLSGFYGSFILLVILWLLLDTRRKPDDGVS